MNNFYVYGHYTADTDTLFYIGKGKARRAWSTYKRNPYWERKVQKHGLVVKLLVEGLTEAEAFQREKDLINEVGLDTLTNIIEGGDGPTSADMKRMWSDPEMRKKGKLAGQRRSQDPLWKARHDRAMRENAKKPEVLAKLRQLAQWKSQDEGFKQRQKTAIRKVTQTAAWKQKYRKATWENPEWVAKHRERGQRLQQTFEIVSPTGEVLQLRGKQAFCRQYGLKYEKVQPLFSGKIKSYKGWRLVGTPPPTPNPNNTEVYPQFVSPDNTVYTNITNLPAFCAQHGLSPYAMHRVHLGKSKHHKGWRTTTATIYKTYTGFVSPEGVVYPNITHLSHFCTIHGLDRSNMSKVARGVAKSYKGWTVYVPHNKKYTEFFLYQ